MATIKDLPYELLYHIIFLLVQSSGGAEEFARIIAVCRDFLPYAEDASILRVVNFDIKMELVNFHWFQNVKGLLVKCSEAGNVAAQHVLGKVILLSSTHLFLSERQEGRFSVSPYDRSELRVLDTNVPSLNTKVSSFMAYFSPIQVYTSEFSPGRLVHYQLVKLFLLNGSHHDFIEMGVFLKYCMKYLMGVTRENSCLIAYVKLLVLRALCIRALEKMAKSRESFNECFRGVGEAVKVRVRNLDRNFEDLSSARIGNSSENLSVENSILLKQMLRCVTVGVNWREELNDMNFDEALREYMSDRFNEAYTNFSLIRAETVDHFEGMFG